MRRKSNLIYILLMGCIILVSGCYTNRTVELPYRETANALVMQTPIGPVSSRFLIKYKSESGDIIVEEHNFEELVPVPKGTREILIELKANGKVSFTVMKEWRIKYSDIPFLIETRIKESVSGSFSGFIDCVPDYVVKKEKNAEIELRISIIVEETRLVWFTVRFIKPEM